MNKIYTLLIFTLFIGMGSSYAQSTSIKSIEKSAKKAMENKDFYSAWQFYKMTTTQRSVKKDSTKLAKQMYNLGESARQFKSYDVAKNAYEMVLSSKTKADYPLAEFWLARVYHSQGEYDKAISHYSNFTKEAGQTAKGGNVNLKQEYAAVAESAIQNCKWAKDQREFTGFKMDSLKSVNTAATEFAPVEYNSSMYYSALEYDKENFCPDPNSEVTRLYTSDYAGEGGTTSPINWAKDEKGTFVAHTAFNGTGDRMYFTLCKRINAAEFECEIYFRDKSSGFWGDAIRLSEEINLTGTTNTQPNIGVGYDENGLEKELLFFVSNRSDSLGGANSDMNIYCGFIDSMGHVGTPWKININTSEDDVTPFFNKANKTLYFSSRGYQGFGGYDIYQAEQKGSEFTQPLALEKPINSSYDDYYFSSDDEMETLYFSTNRLGVTYEDEGLETCCDDIYKLEIIKVKLEVTTFNTLTGEEGLDSCEVALYDVTNPNNPILVGEKKLDPNGNFYEFPLELEKDYRVESVRGKRWTNADTEFTTKNITSSQTIQKQLYHTPDIEWRVYAFSKFRANESSEYLTRDLNGGTFTVNSQASVEEDNLFEMDLEFGKEYNLVVSKVGYSADGNTNEVYRNTTPYTTPTTLIDTVYLIDEYITLGVEAKVYFHNDKPFRTDGRRSKNQRITNEEYINLYDAYVDENGMVKTYIDKNKKHGGQNEEEVLSFFRDSVTVGKTQLDLFIGYLELLVEEYKGSNDYYFEITINGYTSPRATKAYNDNLAYRRIYSINNYIKEKGSPALRAALPKDANDRSVDNNNLFIFKLVSIGEKPDEDASLEVIKSIPDNGELSVYGINASRRRKVVVKTIERKLRPISR